MRSSALNRILTPISRKRQASYGSRSCLKVSSTLPTSRSSIPLKQTYVHTSAVVLSRALTVSLSCLVFLGLLGGFTLCGCRRSRRILQKSHAPRFDKTDRYATSMDIGQRNKGQRASDIFLVSDSSARGAGKKLNGRKKVDKNQIGMPSEFR